MKEKSKSSGLKNLFTAFAEKSATAAGTPIAFMLALLSLLVWAGTGPIYGYSEVWQIVINTVTSIITFLLVFLIQNSQNRETRAVQLKLDEIIRATEGAHNAMLRLEKLSDEELEDTCKEYEALLEVARKRLRSGEDDRDAPEIKLSPKKDQNHKAAV
jgi:low affinity Fe/Cu permease